MIGEVREGDREGQVVGSDRGGCDANEKDACCAATEKAECCGPSWPPSSCGCRAAAHRTEGNDMTRETLPVAVIGAGPVGLAAAAHLVRKGQTPLILEAGLTVGASILKWGHVRIFSPWEHNVDAASAAPLGACGGPPPADTEYPTGHELVERYLRPLGDHDRIRPHLRLDTR